MPILSKNKKRGKEQDLGIVLDAPLSPQPPEVSLNYPVTAPQPEVTAPIPVEKNKQEQEISYDQQQPAIPEVQRPGVRGTTTAVQQPVAPVAPIVPVKTAARVDIESILSDGLTKIYQSMTPEEQLKFRTKGEESASAIEQMMTTFSATARRVLQLIRDWLATIPRVNKYFLEQESKIKTDRMMKLQRKLRKEQRTKQFGQ
ncbi:MAG: hypothetical protein HYV32_06005 [Candidatus Kerfeldbacteria bacterium]|nr:hypothetical protein [Candidatus Kerfeldbacteria bacterium]